MLNFVIQRGVVNLIWSQGSRNTPYLSKKWILLHTKGCQEGLIRKGDNLRCEKRRLGVQTVHSKKYWKNNESCTTKVSWIGSFHVNHDFPVRFVCHVHPVCPVCPELRFVATVTTGCRVKFVPTV